MEKIKTGGLAKTIEVIATYNREVSLIFYG